MSETFGSPEAFFDTPELLDFSFTHRAEAGLMADSLANESQICKSIGFLMAEANGLYFKANGKSLPPGPLASGDSVKINLPPSGEAEEREELRYVMVTQMSGGIAVSENFLSKSAHGPSRCAIKKYEFSDKNGKVDLHVTYRMTLAAPASGIRRSHLYVSSRKPARCLDRHQELLLSETSKSLTSASFYQIFSCHLLLREAGEAYDRQGA